MKKVIIVLMLLTAIILIYSIYLYKHRNNNTMDGDNMIYEEIEELEIEINGNKLSLEIEDNDATRTLTNKLKDNEISISMNPYGGFEYVGELGFSLPTTDTKIKTNPGDVVLYQGNQLVIFYGSNTWEYTKIGHIKNISNKELEELLNTNNSTVILRRNK